MEEFGACYTPAKIDQRETLEVGSIPSSRDLICNCQDEDQLRSASSPFPKIMMGPSTIS